MSFINPWSGRPGAGLTTSRPNGLTGESNQPNAANRQPRRKRPTTKISSTARRSLTDNKYNTENYTQSGIQGSSGTRQRMLKNKKGFGNMGIVGNQEKLGGFNPTHNVDSQGKSVTQYMGMSSYDARILMDKNATERKRNRPKRVTKGFEKFDYTKNIEREKKRQAKLALLKKSTPQQEAKPKTVFKKMGSTGSV